MTKLSTLVLTLVLTAETRVRTSEGKALFYIPGTEVELDADEAYAGKWVHLPEGTEVKLCATYEKTDTYMCAVTFPAHVDEDVGDRIPAMTYGMVFRQKTWDKLQSAQLVEDLSDEAPVEDADEAVDTAPEAAGDSEE